MTRRLFYYTQPNCAPCKAVRPVAEALAAQAGVEFVPLDVSDPTAASLATFHKVRATPTLVVVNDTGERVVGMLGTMLNKEMLLRHLTPAA